MRWTPDDDSCLLDLKARGVDEFKIGSELNRTAAAIVRRYQYLKAGTASRSSDMSPWTPERIEKLKKLQRDGLSCSVIAARLGCGLTRNAVIGKLSRLGLSRGIPPTVRKKITPRRPHPGNPSIPRQTKASPLYGPHEPIPLPAETDIPRIAFADLAPSQCRWVVGDPKPTAMCCGDETIPGKPYCKAHLIRATIPTGGHAPRVWLPHVITTPLEPVSLNEVIHAPA
jgi:GcrA cell cycle regulator